MARVTIGGRSYEVQVRGDLVVVDGQEYVVTTRAENGYLTVTAGGVAYRVGLPAEHGRASGMAVEVDYRPFTLEYEGPLSGRPAARPPRAAAQAAAERAPTAKGAITAQIAGRILSVRVTQGDAVKRGDILLVLEAMKMENEVRAVADGVVAAVHVAEGARVAEGDTLVVVE